MAKRQRNHFIPRLLLNRFASRRDVHKSWIWQVPRSGDAVEISTRDAAVEGHFYGKPDTGVEDALADAETLFGVVLKQIDQGDDPARHSAVLRRLVWNLAVRTRALRRQFSKTTGAILARMIASASSADARRALARYARENFDELARDQISKMSPAEQQVFNVALEQPVIRELMMRAIEQQAQSSALLEFLQQIGNQMMRPGLSQYVDSGHIRGLAKLLDSGGAPSTFAPREWSVVSVSPSTLILGDGCVLASTPEGFRSLLGAQNWEAVLVPISSSTLLVGSRGQSEPVPNPEHVNIASAELSFSHIYSAQWTDLERRLSRSIAEGNVFLSEQEIADMVDRAWVDL